MTTEQREAIDRLNSLLKKGKYAVAGKTLLYEDYYMLKNVLEVVENQERKIIKQQEENKKKDEIIELMAEYWHAGLAMCDNCDKIVENYDKNNCKDCIKQYFENKVNSKIQ